MGRFPAEHFLPAEGDDIQFLERDVLGEHGRGGIADHDAVGIGADPAMIVHAHAGGRAVPGEDDIGLVARAVEVRQDAIVADMDLAVFQPQLFLRIGHPVLAEAFPGEDVHRPKTEHGPHAHFHRAGIGCRHDADPVAFRQVQDGPGPLDGLGEFRLGEFRAVRAAKRSGFKLVEGKARAFRRGARRKVRTRGTRLRLGSNAHLFVSYPYR